MTDKPHPKIDRILLRASVSGPFDPLTFVSGLDGAETRELAAELTRYFEEAPGGGGTDWVMKPSVRREQLERIDSRAMLSAALEGAPQAPPDDLFTRTLRASLQGKRLPSPRGVHPRELADTRHTALQFTQAAPAVAKERWQRDFDAVRAVLARDHLDRAVDTALPGTLYGRTAQRNRIAKLLSKSGPEVRPILVTGIGGIGKSALVVDLVREWRREGAAVILDFDQRALGPGRPIPVFRELLRQLQWHFAGDRENTDPGPSHALAEVQSFMRDFELKLSERESLAEQVRFVRGGVIGQLRSTAPESLRQLPLLVVFDSFEAVGRNGPGVVEALLQLEVDLRTEGPFTLMRTIVSCREPPLRESSEVTRWFGPTDRRVPVEGISADAGSKLLRSKDRNARFQSKDLRRRAAKALNGNPLAIIVLERYARNRAEDEIASLVEDLSSNDAFKAEFAQSFLYTRILDRIADPEVARLAHPGLVLRYLTPDLIRLILAEPCGLGALTRQRAENLFSALAEEYWLVEPDGAGLRHRPDLRRLMLPALFAGSAPADTRHEAKRKAELRSATVQACKAAARYYAQGPSRDDPARADWKALPERQRRAEATYYNALAGAEAPAELAAAEAGELRDTLGEDLQTLPPAWRALVNAATGDFVRLSNEERQLLTGRLAAEAEAIRAERIVETASEAFPDSKLGGSSSRDMRPTTSLGFTEAEASAVLRERESRLRSGFRSARWHEAAEFGRYVLAAFRAGHTSDVARREIDGRRSWTSSIWEAVLAHVALGDEALLLQEGPFSAFKHRTEQMELLALLCDAALGGAPTSRFLLQPPTGNSVTGLRLMHLAMRSGSHPPLSRLAVDSDALSLADEGVIGLLSGPQALLMYDENRGSRLHKLWQGQRLRASELEGAYAKPVPLRLSESLAARLARGPVPELRGLTPELHGAAAHLLGQITTARIRGLLNLVSSRAPAWPYDSASLAVFQAAAPRLGGRRTGASRAGGSDLLDIVVTADRCGQFRLLLEWLADEREDARPLLTIYRMLDRRIFGLNEEEGTTYA